MAGEEPEKGDKVSWQWGSGAPGGTVAEKKTEGEISIKSKRGNTIKKNASSDNPAVHIERSGNDVVKRVSELNVEQKASGSNGKKREHENDEEEEEEPLVENADGKEIKAGGKKQKTEKAAPKKKDTKKDEKKDDKKAEKEVEKKQEEEEKAEATGEKKKAGRPKKDSESGTSKKKEKKPRSAEGIGSRTRSRA